MTNNLPPRLQDLPPNWAHFCLGIDNFVRQELGLDPKKRTLLLALSGGVDSSALLLVLYYLSQKWQCRLLAAHLNHQLRPESEAEAEAVQNLCQRLNIPLFRGSSHVRTYSRKMKKGLEEASRTIRYRFLQGIKVKQGADYLLTAHQLNDLAEDSLLRQIRGTGWPALAGMQAWNKDKQVLRPLLLTPKTKLQAFLQDLDIPWQEDLSNQDPAFKRNRVRNSVLPLLIGENPAYLDKVVWLWRQARLEDSYWQEKLDELRKAEQTRGQEILLPSNVLSTLHRALRLRWYKDILQRMGPGQVLADTLFSLDQAFMEDKKNKTFQFPGNKKAFIKAEGVLFIKT